MRKISGIDWDLEEVHHEPMGHEWGDAGTFDDAFDLPLEARSDADPTSQTATAAPIGTEDFGGGSPSADHAAVEDLAPGSPDEVPTGEPFVDPEDVPELPDMSEVDPFDAFDEEFAQVLEEMRPDLPELEALIDG